MSFKPGDVVVRRSGGPVMIVEKIGHVAVFCTWFEKADQKRGHFAPAAIEIYENKRPARPLVGLSGVSS
jgi:uncharacterized protein YodC (DUF2158 family)